MGVYKQPTNGSGWRDAEPLTRAEQVTGTRAATDNVARSSEHYIGDSERPIERNAMDKAWSDVLGEVEAAIARLRFEATEECLFRGQANHTLSLIHI